MLNACLSTKNTKDLYIQEGKIPRSMIRVLPYYNVSKTQYQRRYVSAIIFGDCIVLLDKRVCWLKVSTLSSV